MRQITPLSVTSDVPTLVADLLANNEAYLVTLNESFAMANEKNQQGIADFIAGRILTHQKWSWQLKSSLPSPSIAEARRRFR
jgi:DNA-binding ferritin-like protein